MHTSDKYTQNMIMSGFLSVSNPSSMKQKTPFYINQKSEH